MVLAGSNRPGTGVAFTIDPCAPDIFIQNDTAADPLRGKQELTVVLDRFSCYIVGIIPNSSSATKAHGWRGQSNRG